MAEDEKTLCDVVSCGCNRATGERIRFIRNLRGMTQKYLGTLVGFPEKTADIRVAQYESGTRTPKDDLTKALADVLDVSPLALSVPDIDSQLGLMHTLFALEDLYGLKTNIADGEVTLHFDVSNISDPSFFEMVTAWAEQAAKYKSGEISKEDYDKWRYRFPEFDTTQIWAKVPSKQLSDALVDAFKDKLKD